MKIAVISDLPHFVVGGAEMQAARLIEVWLDQGHEVVCLGRRMGKGPVTIGRHIMEVKRIGTASALGRLGRATSYGASLSWHLLHLRRRVDVVYTRFLGEGASTAAWLKELGLLHVPIVATPANTHGAGDLAFLRSVPFSSRLLALLENRCDAINLIAPDMAAELREAGFSGRNFSNIPNGIVVKPPHHRSTDAPLRFVSVGRLAPQKGYDILIEALSLIRGALSPKQFVVVGDGPERERLQALTEKHGLTNIITWAGEQDQAAVARHLEQASVFVLPSRYEGMANAGLEAMERSLPVLITRCGGLDRYINSQMGWTPTPENPPQLATAIMEAIATPPQRLAEMGSLCRDKVLQEFDITITAQRYISLFERLLAGHRPTRFTS